MGETADVDMGALPLLPAVYGTPRIIGSSTCAPLLPYAVGDVDAPTSAAMKLLPACSRSTSGALCTPWLE